MRCPECNTFVSYEDPDPEVLDLDVDSAEVTAEIRITRCCADCGCELLESVVPTMDWIGDVYEAHLTDEARLDLEETAAEDGGPDPTDGEIREWTEELRADHTLEVFECASGQHEGTLPGRPRRPCQEAWVAYRVECSCGWSHDGELRESIPADELEVLV